MAKYMPSHPPHPAIRKSPSFGVNLLRLNYLLPLNFPCAFEMDKPFTWLPLDNAAKIFLLLPQENIQLFSGYRSSWKAE